MDVFCAGLVTDFGPVSEGINHEAWLGLQDAKAKNGLDRIDVIETVDVRDRAKNIATFAVDSYDIIVTVGSSISNETLTAAKNYPKLLFIGVEQPQKAKAPNLAGLVFHEEQSGFLSGALAALMTQTQRVGAVCEAKFIDPMRRYCDGFQAGARYINPQMNVTISYREASTRYNKWSKAWMFCLQQAGPPPTRRWKLPHRMACTSSARRQISMRGLHPACRILPMFAEGC